LTDDPDVDVFPRWSPDGSQIAFSSNRSGNSNIYVMDADGSNLTLLTEDPAGGNAPSWSPDGSQILFHSERNGNVDIYVMDADGTNVKRLTNDPAPDVSPTWSPDGRHIAFVSLRGGDVFDLYVIDINGDNPTRLTQMDDDVEFPVWSPSTNILTSPIAVPTMVPSPTPSPPPPTETPAPGSGGAGCPVATDATYGYTPGNPFRVGGGPFGGGPSNERAVLDALRGPGGQVLSYERTGSFIEGDTILDEYVVTYEGLSGSIYLYFDIYTDEPRLVPVGLTCGMPLP
jgi:hypothetical protein